MTKISLRKDFTPQAKTYLSNRGLSPKLLEQPDWRVLADAAKAGYGPFHAPAIFIPFYDHHGTRIDHWTVRYLTEIYDQEKKLVRFRTPEGATPPRAYFPRGYDWKNYFSKPAKERDELVLTEGPLKAEAAVSKGIACVALAGVWNYRAKGTYLIPDLAQLPLDESTVAITYDSDAKENDHVLSAEKGLHSALLQCFPRIRCGRKQLPKLEGKKTGLDDFLKVKSAREFRTIAIAPILPQLRALQLDKFLEHKFPPMVTILESEAGPLMQEPMLIQIHAYRGVGKTTVLLQLLYALSNKAQFFRWHGVRKMKVLFIEGEMPAAKLQKKMKELGFDAELKNFEIMPRELQESGAFPRLATPEGQAVFAKYLTDNKIEVVALDSLSTLANIPMNKEEEQIALSDFLIHLRTVLRVTVVYLQHDGKGGEQRGHSKHEDWLDLSIHLQWEGDYQGADGLRCKWKFDKARDRILDGAAMKISLGQDLKDARKLVWNFTDLSSEDEKTEEIVTKITARLGVNPKLSTAKLLESLRIEGVKGDDKKLRALIKKVHATLEVESKRVAASKANGKAVDVVSQAEPELKVPKY